MKEKILCPVCSEELFKVYGLSENYRCIECNLVFKKYQAKKEYTGVAELNDLVEVLNMYVRYVLNQSTMKDYEQFDELLEKYDLTIAKEEVVLKE